MPVKMKNKRFRGEANVKSRDVPTWEAAGWEAVPEPPKKTTSKKETDQ